MCYHCTWHKLSCKSPRLCAEVQAMFGTVIRRYLSSSKERKGMGRNSWNAAMFVTGTILGSKCFWVLLSLSQNKQPQKRFLREWCSTLEPQAQEIEPGPRWGCHVSQAATTLRNRLKDNKTHSIRRSPHCPSDPSMQVPSVPLVWCTPVPQRKFTEVIPYAWGDSCEYRSTNLTQPFQNTLRKTTINTTTLIFFKKSTWKVFII